jgi:hypothetical protein
MSLSHGHSHPQPHRADNDATVDIHDAVAGVLSVLEIDAPAHNDVACTVESTLFDLRVQVVRVRSRRTRRRAVHEYEVVEFDGAPLRVGRQREVRTALLARLRLS